MSASPSNPGPPSPGGPRPGGPAGHAPRRRSLARRLLLSLVVTVLSLVLLELAARAALYAGAWALLPTDEMRTFVTEEQLEFDPVYGWAPAGGGADGVVYDLMTNARERLTLAEQRRSLRVFTLGDSQTQGAALTHAQTWPSQAEAALRERGVDVLFINFGSSGYSSGHVLRLVEREVLPRDPDLILVDCHVEDGPELPRDYDDPTVELRRVLFYSRLYRVLRLGVAGAEGEALLPEQERHLPEQVPRTTGKGNHQHLVDVAAKAGVPLVFMDYPVMGDPVMSLAPASRLPRGADVVPSTAALLASGKGRTELFFDHNHLTPEGAAIVGKAVADHVEARLRGLAEAKGLAPLAPGDVALPELKLMGRPLEPGETLPTGARSGPPPPPAPHGPPPGAAAPVPGAAPGVAATPGAAAPPAGP